MNFFFGKKCLNKNCFGIIWIKVSQETKQASITADSFGRNSHILGIVFYLYLKCVNI